MPKERYTYLKREYYFLQKHQNTHSHFHAVSHTIVNLFQSSSEESESDASSAEKEQERARERDVEGESEVQSARPEERATGTLNPFSLSLTEDTVLHAIFQSHKHDADASKTPAGEGE